jgi:hypothetical protein
VKFYDTTNNNFTLRPASPAIDAGKNLSSDSVLFDYYYTSRPIGTAFDIGAFEYDSLALSISKNEKDEFRIYPNPAKDVFTIKASLSEFLLKVLSIKGQLMMCREKMTSGDKISLKTLSPGIYIVRLTEPHTGKSLTQKLIVQ